MSGKHARREPGLSTGELELHFPAHRRPDNPTPEQIDVVHAATAGPDEATKVDE